MANETESCQPDMPTRYGLVIGSSKTKPNRQWTKWSLSSADVRGEELVTSLRTSAWEATFPLTTVFDKNFNEVPLERFPPKKIKFNFLFYNYLFSRWLCMLILDTTCKCQKVFALFKHIDGKKNARAKQRRKHKIICCDHVNKCFKCSKIKLNKVADNFSNPKES